MVTSAAAELPLFTAGVPIKQIRDTFDRLLDVRKGGNNQRYTVADAALSAFSVFFSQSPSFLDYQVRMQKERGHNTLGLEGVVVFVLDFPVAAACRDDRDHGGRHEHAASGRWRGCAWND